MVMQGREPEEVRKIHRSFEKYFAVVHGPLPWCPPKAVVLSGLRQIEELRRRDEKSLIEYLPQPWRTRRRPGVVFARRPRIGMIPSWA